MRALDPTTGAVLWAITLSDRDAPRIAIHRGRVFVSCSGTLFCIDYSSGQGLWRQPSLGTREHLIQNRARNVNPGPLLLVDGDRVFVLGGDATLCFHIDGRPLWKTDHPHDSFPCAALPGQSARGELGW